MTMKKNRLRLLSALLALAMAVSLAPTAWAVAVACPRCGSTNGATRVVREATCTEKGLYEYICPNEECVLRGVSQLITGATDPNNHDAVYSDNGDGTHSGVCHNHNQDVAIPAEPHIYNNNGLCEKCGAVDYSQVSMNLPETMVVPVALNDASAKLTVNDIRLTLGSADITADYEINYMWYDRQGDKVAATAECPLPASVTSNEGVYFYSLYVMAVPRNTLTRQPISRTCSVTVQVQELITANATITTEDTRFYLGSEDSWSAYSVSAQIYEAVQLLCSRRAEPDYVRFSAPPTSAVGSLRVNTGRNYSFDERDLFPLDDVEFIPGAAAGNYVIGFTAYDTDGESYAGVLTITVQQYVGSMDVLYTVNQNTPVAFDPDDFEDFWFKTHPRGELDSISFDELPRSVEGSLYLDYTSAARPGSRVKTSDSFFIYPGRNQYGIDSITFIPGVKQADYITIPFTAYGINSKGRSTSLEGTVYIFFNSANTSADVSVVTAANGEAALDPAAFQKAYQAVTGATGANFYIQLLDVPASGSLYVGRTASRQGSLVTLANIANRPFAYNDTRGEAIGSLTYVRGTAAAESIRYVACNAQGEAVFTGKINFTAYGAPTTADPGTTAPTALVVPYSCTSGGVGFRAADFENLLGASNLKLNSVSFTPPSALYGTLYYGRTGTNPGVAITSSVTWFNVSSVPLTGTYSMNSMSFVPAAGYTGIVTIPFTALDTSSNQYTGTVRITVTATTSTPGTTPQNPVKDFPDVPKTEWYYTYVMDLVASGVLGGYSDGTFRPGSTVTLGQALKMIMMAVGYPDLSTTGSDWAKPFLTRAKADGLLPDNVNEDLNRNVNRYTIAEIAARAMKLNPAVVTVSPFKDMTTSVSSAPYVMALYNIGVIGGSTNKNGETVYYGVNAITRSEFAAIIWRMQNYVKTGNANGTTAVG